MPAVSFMKGFSRRRVIGISLVVALLTAIGLLWWDLPSSRADRAVSMRSGVDEIIIVRLQGTDAQEQSSTVSVDPYDSNYGSYGEKALVGTDVDKFWEHWSEIDPGGGSTTLCHDPVYYFIFKHDGKIVFRTSVCWACENFFVTSKLFGSGWINFASSGEPARKLLEYCDQLLPYDRSYSERREKEIEALLESYNKGEFEK